MKTGKNPIYPMKLVSEQEPPPHKDTVFSHIRIFNAALDESGGEIILRGSLDLSCIPAIRVGSYQRGKLTLHDLASIIEALEEGAPIPDIILGMRGQHFDSTTGGDYILYDPVYVVDGLQRLTAITHFLTLNKTQPVRIGAKVHFDTTEKSETEIFEKQDRVKKISASLHLRNKRETSIGVVQCYGLSMNDPEFPLYHRISWGQSMERGHVMSAITMARTSALLHRHKAAIAIARWYGIADTLDKACSKIGTNQLRENIKTFFNLIDYAWGLKALSFRESNPQLKGGFLSALANILSEYMDFWADEDSKILRISSLDREKFKGLHIHDPAYAQLASAVGQPAKILRDRIVYHLNSNRTKNRLRSRHQSHREED